MGVFLSLTLGFVLLVLAVGVSRANELFVLSVRRGRTLYVRGRISGALLSEIDEVAARLAIERATIRAVFEQGRIRVLCDHGGELFAQRIRNVVGTKTERKLRDARAPLKRNWGQKLGISWLAWRLDGKR